MVVGTCVCVGQLGAYTIAFVHGPNHWWIKCKKSNKCVVGYLLQEGGLGQIYIATKLVAFGLDGISDFQGARLVRRNKFKKHVPHSTWGCIVSLIKQTWLCKHCFIFL
jgi:hypothetical protein